MIGTQEGKTYMNPRQRQSEQILNLNLNQNRNLFPSLVRDAISLMEAEFAGLYGIDELAERLEVSKYHLIRVFSANTGISPGNYLIGLRISHAKRLLQSRGNTPLEIIAGACGYSCSNYFCKAFKKQTGMTPSEYAEAFRRESGDADTDLLLQKLYL